MFNEETIGNRKSNPCFSPYPRFFILSRRMYGSFLVVRLVLQDEFLEEQLYLCYSDQVLEQLVMFVFVACPHLSSLIGSSHSMLLLLRISINTLWTRKTFVQWSTPCDDWTSSRLPRSGEKLPSNLSSSATVGQGKLNLPPAPDTSIAAARH